MGAGKVNESVGGERRGHGNIAAAVELPEWFARGEVVAAGVVPAIDRDLLSVGGLEKMRARKKPVEDAVFGFRAAGPALLANVSYFEKRMCHWKPDTMSVG